MQQGSSTCKCKTNNLEQCMMNTSTPEPCRHTKYCGRIDAATQRHQPMHALAHNMRCVHVRAWLSTRSMRTCARREVFATARGTRSKGARAAAALRPTTTPLFVPAALGATSQPSCMRRSTSLPCPCLHAARTHMTCPPANTIAAFVHARNKGTCIAATSKRPARPDSAAALQSPRHWPAGLTWHLTAKPDVYGM